MEEQIKQNKTFKLYANETQIGVSVYDVSLVFKHNTAIDQEVLGTITISPQHFKAITELFLTNLQQYEDTFGKIVLPVFEQPQQ